MTVIKTVGVYEITCEKKDRICSELVEFIGLSVLVSFIAIIPFGILLFVVLSEMAIPILILWVMVGLILLCICQSTIGCGVEICLKTGYTGTVVSKYSYRFGAYPDADAEFIRKKCEYLTQRANELTISKQLADEQEREKKRQCCTQYKTVIDKVREE